MSHPVLNLYKICSQCSHFIFGFFRIAPTPPSSASSSSFCTSTSMHGVPHGGVFKLHHILEDRITENTASVLGLIVRKWCAGFVEVYSYQEGIACITAFLSNLRGKTVTSETLSRIKQNQKNSQPIVH